MTTEDWLRLANHFRGPSASRGTAFGIAQCFFGEGERYFVETFWFNGIPNDTTLDRENRYEDAARICESLAYDNTDGPS